MIVPLPICPSRDVSSWFQAVRPAFFESVVARSGSVRFGSASGSGRFCNSTVRLGSVRPFRFGCLILPAKCYVHKAHAKCALRSTHANTY